MVAQTHLMFEQGKDETLKEHMEAEAEAQKAIAEQLSEDEEDLEEFKASEGWSLPDDLERHRAKKAFDEITGRLKKRDLNSDALFEDLLSEKAYELERFVTKKADGPAPEQQDPSQDLLDFAKADLDGQAEAEGRSARHSRAGNDAAIRKRIQAIMNEYAAPKAMGGKSYNLYEDAKESAKPLKEPELRVQK